MKVLLLASAATAAMMTFLKLRPKTTEQIAGKFFKMIDELEEAAKGHFARAQKFSDEAEALHDETCDEADIMREDARLAYYQTLKDAEDFEEAGMQAVEKMDAKWEEAVAESDKARATAIQLRQAFGG